MAVDVNPSQDDDRDEQHGQDDPHDRAAVERGAGLPGRKAASQPCKKGFTSVRACAGTSGQGREKQGKSFQSSAHRTEHFNRLNERGGGPKGPSGVQHPLQMTRGAGLKAD